MVTKELKNTKLTEKSKVCSSVRTYNSFPQERGVFQMKQFKQGIELGKCQMKHPLVGIVSRCHNWAPVSRYSADLHHCDI